MKTIQLTRAVVKHSATPFPFLLPAFAPTSASSSVRFVQKPKAGSPASSSRYLSSSTPRRSERADTNGNAQSPPTQGTGQAKTSGNATQQQPRGPEARTSLPHSRRAISDQFNDIIGPRTLPRPGRLGGMSAIGERGRSPGDMQGALAEEMGLGRNYGPLGSIGGGGASAFVKSSGFGYVAPPPAPKRLDAFVGRSEQIKGHVTLPMALRALDMKLAMNRVRSDQAMQKFHERPGKKRKRLASLRWRRRFKEGFGALVDKVIRMKKMGW